MSNLSDNVNIASVGGESANKDTTEQEVTFLFSVGETYWFVVNNWAYNGIYVKKDRFIANNIILMTIDNVTWSVDIRQVFKTKEECTQFAIDNYGEEYADGSKKLKFGPEYTVA